MIRLEGKYRSVCIIDHGRDRNQAKLPVADFYGGFAVPAGSG
jgi:hypothetical protein